MSRFTQLGILIIATMALLLFGLTSAPSLAGEADPHHPIFRNLYDVTFTPVATAFLPIVIAPPRTLTPTPTTPPPANLEIVNLSYSGSDEYVTIHNSGGSTQLLNGWRLVSVIGPQTYYFPNGFSLGPNQSLRIHSGPGAFDNPPGDLYWTSAYIWNNNGDKAELRDDQGVVRDSWCYGDGC